MCNAFQRLLCLRDITEMFSEYYAVNSFWWLTSNNIKVKKVGVEIKVELIKWKKILH